MTAGQMWLLSSALILSILSILLSLSNAPSVGDDPGYSPTVFLFLAAGLGADFLPTWIGTMSPMGAPQPSLAGILGCLYE